MTDRAYMKLALELAKKGCGFVNPNPMVGAMIVKNSEIIGLGFHKKYGEFHAERNAITNCKASPFGSTIYVTLEPCCHYGKTPPCTDAIIESGIKKVVIGSKDPNPLVAGKGIDILRKNGIEVTQGVLEKECDKLNEVFFHFIESKTPFVVLKYAMTMDGKIATFTGDSKWISSEKARHRVHEDRHRYSAIMIGVGTVIADDPMLNCRLQNSKNPIRIICDTHLRTPLDCKIIKTAREIKTIIATCNFNAQKHIPFMDAGCETIIVSEENGNLNLEQLMVKLGRMNIDSVLIEGGPTLNWSALKSGIVKRIQTYIAPKILGGETAKSPVGGKGIASLKDAICLENITITKLGSDYLIESDVKKHVYRNN